MDYYGLESPETDLSQLDDKTLSTELEEINTQRVALADSGENPLELKRLIKMQEDVVKEQQKREDKRIAESPESGRIDLGEYSTEFLKGIQDGTQSTLGMDAATVNAIMVLDLEKDNPNLTEDGQAVNLSEDVKIQPPSETPGGDGTTTKGGDKPPTTPPPTKTLAGKAIDALGGVKGLARGAMTLLALSQGRKHIKEAMKDIPIEEGNKLDGAWKGYMAKMREAAQSGMSAEQKYAAQSDLSTAYNLGVKNVARASGGNRGTFLSNMGMLKWHMMKTLDNLLYMVL